MRIARSVGLAAIVACTTVAGAQAKTRIPDGDWRTVNRDLASTRFSPLDQINRTNVSKLAVAWSYAMHGYGTASPLVIDGVMYFPAGARVVAVDRRHRQGNLGPYRTARPQGSLRRPFHARRRLLARRQEDPGPHHGHAGFAHAGARRQDRRAREVLRRRRLPERGGRLWRHADDLGRRRGDRRGHHRGSARRGGQPARLRRADRQEAVGIPDRAAARPAVSRHLGRWLEGPVGHQHVGVLGPRGRKARPGVHPPRLALPQLLARRRPRGQRVLGLHSRPGAQDGQIPLALPDGPTTTCGIPTCPAAGR